MSEETFGVEEAGAFLNACRNTILELAATGELPGAKIGREWVFLKSDVVEYLRKKIREQSSQRRSLNAADHIIEKGKQNNPRSIMTSVGQIRRATHRKTPPPLPEVPSPEFLSQLRSA